MERQNNAELARAFLRYLRDKRNRTPATITDYGDVLVRYVDFLGNRGVAAATLHTLEAFVERPRLRLDGRQAAPASRAKECAILRSFYGFLHARELIAKNPAALLVGPKVNNRNPRPINDLDWITLWNSLERDDDRVAFGLGFYGGLRVYEIRHLAPGHIVWPNIVGFVRKGGDDDILCLGDMLAVFDAKLPQLQAGSFQFYLEPYVAKREGKALLLPWADKAKNYMNDRLMRACRRAELPPYTPHQFRHSAATNLIRAGVPQMMVSKLLAHSDTRITARYVKAAGGELREWLRSSVQSATSAPLMVRDD